MKFTADTFSEFAAAIPPIERPGTTIPDCLHHYAAVESDRPVCHLIQGGRTTALTYPDLWREAGRFARLYRDHGVQPGEVVVIVLRHSPELLAAFLGAMLAGAVPSFMPPLTSKQDPGHYWPSHTKLFARIGAGLLLTSADNLSTIRQHLPQLPLRLACADDARTLSPWLDAAPSIPEHVALLQHSSGTTGLKKGVALTHDAVLRQVRSYARSIHLQPTDRIVSWLPLYHDMGLIACFLLPLLTNTPVVLLDPLEWVVNPGTLFSAIREHRGTLCWQPNFAFHHLCRTVRPSPAPDLGTMRAWINCSEPCRADTFQLFARTFAAAGVCESHLQVCYAMAETVFAVTQTLPATVPRVLAVDATALRNEQRVSLVAADTAHHKLLSAGAPIDGTQVRIVDDSRQEMPPDRVGEICVRSECLFAGYHRLPDITARKLQGGWYQTGDLGFLHDGHLFVTGRKDDLIIVHGRNYYAHELEAIVNQAPGVHPGRNVAAGWFRPAVGSDEVIVIAECAVTDDEQRVSLVRQIKQSILDQTGLAVFDVHLVPARWLVKTTSGKISRTENLRQYLAAIGAPATAPSSPT